MLNPTPWAEMQGHVKILVTFESNAQMVCTKTLLAFVMMCQALWHMTLWLVIICQA